MWKKIKDVSKRYPTVIENLDPFFLSFLSHLFCIRSSFDTRIKECLKGTTQTGLWAPSTQEHHSPKDPSDRD